MTTYGVEKRKPLKRTYIQNDTFPIPFRENLRSQSIVIGRNNVYPIPTALLSS
jgi:hypothetical protein